MLGKKSSVATLKEALCIKGVRVPELHFLISNFYLYQEDCFHFSLLFSVFDLNSLIKYLFIICDGSGVCRK